MIILCNTALLHAAADDKKDVLADLTCKVEFFYLGKIPYKKEVTYFYNETQVGYIYYGASFTQPTYGRINKLEIKREFRFQGLGSYILRQALQDLKNDGYIEVQLEPVPFEVAGKDHYREREKLITFYEKNGFRVINFSRTIMQTSL